MADGAGPVAGWRLRAGVEHVLGAHRSALYDLDARRIYWLDASARDALLQVTAAVPSESSGTFKTEDMEQVVETLTRKGLLVLKKCEAIADRAAVLASKMPAPRMAWIELGEGCNHACVHCYNESGPDRFKAAKVDISTLLSAVDQLSAAGVDAIKIIGGEPLTLFGMVMTLARRARELDVACVAVHTNATLLSPAKAAALRRLDVAVDVTVYSDEAAGHDAITATPGSFDKTLRGVIAATEAGLKTSVGLIVTSTNEERVPQILRWWRDRFPAVEVGYDYIRPVGRGEPLYKELRFSHLNRYREHERGFEGIGREDFETRRSHNPCLHDKIMVSGRGVVSPCIMISAHAA